MLLLDVNLILASHRNDHVHFPVARPWLDQMVDSGESFCVPSTVWGSFVRLATDHRIFPRPRDVDEVFDFVESVCIQPGFTPVEPGPRHLGILRRICQEGRVSGRLVSDAILAAIALEHNCEIVTFDSDFARLRSVRYRLLSS